MLARRMMYAWFTVTSLLRRARNTIATTAILFVTAGLTPAQWLKLPLPGTPRSPDGKSNLSAPAPKTPNGKPDLTGIWAADSRAYFLNLAGEGVVAPMQPWAAKLHKERLDNSGRDKPQVRCLPHGAPDAMLVGPDHPFKIIQTPNELAMLGEEFNQYRQIFTDDRTLPVSPNPAWFGYSVGKWEGDTLVVETGGFKEGSWLDQAYPHTDALHLTERFRRLNFGNMELEITIDDPKAYTRPWKSATVHFKLLPDTELIEHLCENEKDAPHLLVK
jgi:hypothetical protein